MKKYAILDIGTNSIKFYLTSIIDGEINVIKDTNNISRLGAGASHTLGKLGSIKNLAGAFVVALSAAITLLWMTKTGLPVSASQAIVGAIIGWNFFSHTSTNLDTLGKIVGTWLFSPILSCIFAFIIFHIVKFFVDNAKIHLLRIDHYTRLGLIIVGSFGAYSLGANNIANVMGVFISSSTFHSINIVNLFTLNNAQILFFMGGIAITIGVFTYSKKVMATVGRNIFKLSPVSALVAVLSSSLVLFLFASQSLRTFLLSLHLPAFPLVPVSSSQAVVGAVMGIGLAKGAKNINYRLFGKIGLGWITTPVASGILSYISLFFMQNVFMHTVH